MIKKLPFLATTAAICCSLAFAPSASAGGGGGGGVGGGGGATEFTQMMNNTELVAMVGQQSQSVAESIRQTLIQQQQYMAQIKSMLPVDEIRSALAPYQQTYSEMSKLYSSTTSLMNSAKNVQGYLTSNYREMSSLNMTPSQYLQWSKQQAQSKKGTYAKKLEEEVKALADFEKRAQNLQAVQEGIPGVEGQIQGLQKLNQTTAITANEMMGLRAAIQQQQATSTQKEYENEMDKEFGLKQRELQQQLDEAEVKSFDKFRAGKGWN